MKKTKYAGIFFTIKVPNNLNKGVQPANIKICCENQPDLEVNYKISSVNS
jgi:hypothetical protein